MSTADWSDPVPGPGSKQGAAGDGLIEKVWRAADWVQAATSMTQSFFRGLTQETSKSSPEDQLDIESVAAGWVENFASRLKNLRDATRDIPESPSDEDIVSVAIGALDRSGAKKGLAISVASKLADVGIWPAVDLKTGSNGLQLIKQIWQMPGGEGDGVALEEFLRRSIAEEQFKAPQAARWAADLICPPMMRVALSGGADAHGHDGEIWQNPIPLCVVLSASKSPDDEAAAIEILQLLEARGVNLSSASRYGIDALSVAKMTKMHELANYLGRYEVTRELSAAVNQEQSAESLQAARRVASRRSAVSAGL